MGTTIVEQLRMTDLFLEEIYDDISERTNWDREQIEDTSLSYGLADKITSMLSERPDWDPDINDKKMFDLEFDLAFKNAGYHDLGEFRMMMNDLPESERDRELFRLFDGYLTLIRDKIR